ncbi:MAG: AbrB/MazE/SpoVT family DNA-binding domain-containing protein [Chloroflexi bacterium]|nr:AbrB/MazE/SpoVT family DNA-binding domain-containing protein [Chloroflexota bacterium]
MATVTVSEKGWVVIPKEVRERFGLKKGDKVHIIDDYGTIMIIPASKGDPIEEGRGMLKGGTGTEGLLEDRRWEYEKEESKMRRPKPRS